MTTANFKIARDANSSVKFNNRLLEAGASWFALVPRVCPLDTVVFLRLGEGYTDAFYIILLSVCKHHRIRAYVRTTE